MQWNRRYPAPLVQPDWTPLEKSSQKYRAYLHYTAIKQLLQGAFPNPEAWLCQTGERSQPWQVENRPHNTLQEGTRQVKEENGYFVEKAIRLDNGWSLAIALDCELETPTVLRLGGEGHRAILESCPALDQQWAKLKDLSDKNFQPAPEYATTELTQKVRSLAYLVTPGVFERLHEGSFVCRAYPWEWNLAHTHNPNQTEGELVSAATDKPLPISCRLRSKSKEQSPTKNGSNSQEEKHLSAPAPQIFAAPPGTVYYLNQPQSLFQDEGSAPPKVRRWRKLGYSELLWIHYKEKND
jgi:CRISPR-associated protein Cmr3